MTCNCLLKLPKIKALSNPQKKNWGFATSTISLRIQKLEEHISLCLLNRMTRKIKLTKIGVLYFEKAILSKKLKLLSHS